MKICDNKSVGMIIRKYDNILLIERKRPPFGFAPPAGHVDDHGSFEDAARNEVQEEVGLKVKNLKLVVEGRKENHCRRSGGTWHYWKIYEVKVEGEVKRNRDETKQTGWFSNEQIGSLVERTHKYLNDEISEEDWKKNPGIEPIWEEWFKELGI